MNVPPLLILDPCTFSPFYDISLGAALSDQGWNVEWVTSEFPFENITVPESMKVSKTFYSGPPVASLLNSKTIKAVTPVRRMIKALTYPLEMTLFHSRLLRRTPGIMHVQWSHLPWLDAILWATWQRRGWKIVYTAHDVIPLKGTTPKSFSLASRMLFRRADAIVIHSEYGRRKVLNMGIESGKISKIHLAPNLISGPRKMDRSAACRMLGLPESRPNILFFGFIKPYKGLDVLLQSLSHVRESIDQVLLIVAGELQERFSCYERDISRLGLKPNIHWSSGYVPSEMIPAYFSAADVVAVPYLQGSSSSAIHTAHDFGKPVVATDVGGLAEQIDERIGDRLVRPNDPLSLSSAIIELLQGVGQGLNESKSEAEMVKRVRARRDEIANQHGDLYLEVWATRNRI